MSISHPIPSNRRTSRVAAPHRSVLRLARVSHASALAMMFLDNERVGIEGGSMYHAVHGLLIYTSRVYGADKLGDLAPHIPTASGKKG